VSPSFFVSMQSQLASWMLHAQLSKEVFYLQANFE